MARFQCLTAAWRSASSFEAQRYIGNSEAMPTLASLSAFLKLLDPVGEDARRLEPFEEIPARTELDPFVAEFGHLARQLLERQVAVHERVEGDLHEGFPP